MPAAAQDTAAVAEELAKMRAEMAAMAERIDTLEAQLGAARAEAQAATTAAGAATASAAAATAASKADEDTTKIAFKGAPEVTGKGGWTFKPRGRLQFDTGFIDAPDSTLRPEGFGSEVRRARLGVQGDMPGGFGYKFEVDFAGNEVALTDANLTDASLREANLSGADLSGADLSGAELSGAELRGAVRITENGLTERLILAKDSGTAGLQVQDSSVRLVFGDRPARQLTLVLQRLEAQSLSFLNTLLASSLDGVAGVFYALVYLVLLPMMVFSSAFRGLAIAGRTTIVPPDRPLPT